MKIFINNKRVKLVDKSRSIKNDNYDVFLTAVEQVDLNKIHGRVLVTNANNEDIISFLKILEMKKLNGVKSFNFLVNDVSGTEKAIKKQFKIIKAAGGVIVKNDKLLLIHRLGIWDMPKGKLENGEAAGDGAVREVEEECGIKAEITAKICSTWHSYTDKDKKILKKTTWYLMKCLDDSQMKPQLEEQIDRIEWMKPSKAEDALAKSYESIRYVMKKFRKLHKNEFAQD